MIYNIIILTTILIIVGLHLYTQHMSEKVLNRLLTEHYSSNEMQVCGISNLTISEKLKYRIPFIPEMFVITGLLSSFGSSEKHYFKKLDIEFQEAEHIIYVDVQIKNNVLIDIEEFDTYSF